MEDTSWQERQRICIQKSEIKQNKLLKQYLSNCIFLIDYSIWIPLKSFNRNACYFNLFSCSVTRSPQFQIFIDQLTNSVVRCFVQKYLHLSYSVAFHSHTYRSKYVYETKIQKDSETSDVKVQCTIVLY